MFAKNKKSFCYLIHLSYLSYYIFRSAKLFQNQYNIGDIICGRSSTDLPNIKLAKIENISKDGFCLPEDFLQDIHERVTKKKQKKNEEFTELVMKGTC